MAAPDSKLLMALISRLNDMLPIKSGVPLNYLEQDPIFNQNVAVIVKLSLHRLNEVASALSGLLETISRSSGFTSDEYSSSTDNQILVHQSQLFVLRLMGNCMAYFWKCYRENVLKGITGENASATLGRNTLAGADGELRTLRQRSSSSVDTADTNNFFGAPTSQPDVSSASDAFSAASSSSTPHQPHRSRSTPAIAKVNLQKLSVQQGPLTGSPQSAVPGNFPPPVGSTAAPPTSSQQAFSAAAAAQFYVQNPNVRPMIDPPPLDENLSKFILSLLLRCFFTSSQLVNPDTINHSFALCLAPPALEYLAAVPSIGSGIPGVVNSTNISAFFLSPTSSYFDTTQGPPSTTLGNMGGSMDRNGGRNLYATTSNIGAGSNAADLPPNSPVTFGSPLEAHTAIQVAAGRILFFLSASNWNVVYSHLRKRFIYLAQIGNNPVAAAAAAAASQQPTTSYVGSPNVSATTSMGGIEEYTPAVNMSAETGDLTEFRMLEWCNLNRQRLSTILADLNSYFRLIPKRAQLLSSVVLRRAIWNWIEAYPMEFVENCRGTKKVEGSPDSLFDTLNSMADNTRRRIVYWPTMTLLLILCPDILYAIGMSGAPGSNQSKAIQASAQGSSVAKKAAFLDQLRKYMRPSGGVAGVISSAANAVSGNGTTSMNGSGNQATIGGAGLNLGDGSTAARHLEVAVFCYVELCRASTFVNKTDGSALRMIVPNIENELKEKLFDPHRGSMDKGAYYTKDSGVVGTPVNQNPYLMHLSPRDKEDAKVAEDFLLDRRIMTECVVALFKLNPWNTLRSLVPVLLDHNAPIVFNVVFVKACFMIVNESYPLPWNPNIDASLASPLRQLFNEFLYREKHLDNRSKNSWGAANVLGRVEKRFRKAVLDDLMENRTEILASTLKTWSRCPLLVMAKDATIIPPEELRALLIGIASCLREHNSTIRTMAAETLLQIFDPDFVGHWDGSRQDWRTHDEIAGGEPGPAAPPPTTPRHDATALRTYWRVSSQVFSSISKQLLEVRADQLDFSERGPSALQITKALLNLLRDLLMRRNEFLRRVLSERIAEAAVANGNTAGGPTNVPVPGTATNERFQASVALENALFVALCSADPEISPTAGMCFALLVDEAELTGESAIARAGSGAIPSLTIVENLQCFKDMKALFEEVRAGGVVLGQKALQKRIRKILRNAVNPTAGNMGAWEEIYRRWRGLTQLTTMRMGSTVSTVEAFRSGIGVINYGDDEELTGNNLDPEILDPRTVERTRADRAGETKEKEHKEKSEKKSEGKIRLMKSKFKNKEPKEDSRATTSMATTSMLGTSAPSSSVLSGTTVGVGNDLSTQTIMPLDIAAPLADFYEDRGEWSNYTGFLSAMGAVCAQTMSSTRYGDPTQKPSNDALAIVEGLADPVADQQNGFTGQQSMGSMSRRQSAHGAQPIGQQPLQYPSSNGSNPDVSAAAAQGMSGQMVAFQMANAFSNARGLAERFVSEMVELLVCDNVMVREAAKDFLGNELATSLYGILFKTLEALVERFFDGKNEVMITERNTVLLESTIAVLKLTIDRAEELSRAAAMVPTALAQDAPITDPAATTAQAESAKMYSQQQFHYHQLDHHMAAFDFGSVILTFVQYVNRIGSVMSSQAPIAMRIRIRLCQLIEVLIARREHVSLRQEVPLRNKLVETMLEWNSEFHNMSRKVGGVNGSSANSSAVAAVVGLMKSMGMVNGGSVGPNGSTADAIASDLGGANQVELVAATVVEQIQMIAVNANQAKLQTDLDVAAMKAMVTVLSGLPLQPTAEGPTAKTAYDEQIMRTTTMKLDEESSDAKSRLFYKYFSFCLKVLQKCKFLETIETAYVGVGAAGSQELLWLQGILSHSKEHMQHLQQLKEYTVLAISNLLSANIDIGLRFSLGMGYHEDVKTRSAFMQVLTNILNMGAAAQFDGLADEGQVLHDRYEKLVDLVVGEQSALGPGTPGSQENVKNAVPNTNGNLTIAMALCETAPVAEVEEVSQVLLNVFESRGLVLRLLKTAVEREVMSTDTSSNLFRRNSMATRLLTMFARTHGQSFLFASLRPILKDIVSRHPPLTFELDPNKLVSTDDRATNLRNLAYASQAFLNAIFANAPNVPPALRAICSMVYATVMQKFPSEGESRAVTGVGGFFFLRFVCPAIVGPESHDLVVQPIVSKDLRRGLVLITKVIQNLANDVLFGVKESFMADLNPLLQDNIGHVHGFLKEISRPVDIDEATMAKRPLEEMDILRLHKHLANNLDKIERLPAATIGTLYQPAILESGKGANSRPVARSTAAAKQIIASVSTLLAQLGAVPDVPRLETRGGSSMGGVQSDFGNGRLGVGPAMTKQHILEFMIRVESRPGLNKALEVLRERKVFYEGPPSKERHPVFYYIARRFVNETIDMELFLYFLLITLRSVVNRQWEFVVDVTKYTAENEWGLEWLSRLEKLLPQEIIMNIHTTYMYNVNSALRKGFKKNRAGQFLRPLMKRIIMIGSISEFAEYIPATDLRLPRSTVAIEKEINSSYQPVYKSIPGGYKVTIPVVIKISQEHIQVTTAKKQDYGGINAFVNDVYHISDVEDVVTWSSSKSNGDDGGEFQIRVAEKVIGRGSNTVGGHSAMTSVTASVNGRESTTPPDTSGNSNTITVLTAMTFASPKRELILQGIRAAKARYQLSRGVGPQYLNAGRRELRPNDVPGTLLNMGLLNIGSDDANLRWSSYNLLYSLSKSFNFDIGNELLVAKGLCIPINNQGFVLAISKRLAASEPNLTLEFLIECGHGFQRSNKELKHYCLEYMAPWLPNLAHYWKASSHAREGSGEIPLPGAQAAETQMAKMNEVLKMLIDMTVNESEMNPLIQSKIWMAIGEVDLMLPFIIDHFVKVAVHHRLGSVQCEVLANTLITLASVNLHIVSGKIIARLRKVISRTSIQQTATLVDHSSWPEISVLARFLLMLSFNNRLDVHQFLPELFHIVNLLVGVGAPIIRSAIHGIVVNIVQSLATSPELDDVGVRTLQLILTELSEPKFSLLFGLKPSSSVTVSSGGANAAFNFSADVLSGDGWRDVPLSSLENIINIMLDVMTFGAPDPEIGATWKSRWMSLVASTAFQFNPAIQPRAFIALGCLARDDADDDLLYQILVTLRGALSLFEENESNLIVSILTALCNIVGGLAPDSRYLKSLFWLAVGLAQIGHIPIFNTAVQLLQVVLRTLDSQGAFTAETLVSGVLLSAREPIADVASLLDNSTGITFRTDFSFALSATLLKGLKNPTTKTATISALMTVLEICAKHEHYSEQAISNGIAGDVQAPVNKVSPYILGYILPLIPFTEKLSNLFWVAGVEPNDEDDLDDFNQTDDIYPTNGRITSAYHFNVGIGSMGGVTPAPDVGMFGIGGPVALPSQQLRMYRRLFSQFDLTALPYLTSLSCALMVTMLENSDNDNESLFMYAFLAEASTNHPDDFSLVWESLLARTMTILSTSNNAQILEAVQHVVKTVVSLRPNYLTNAAQTVIANTSFSFLNGGMPLSPRPSVAGPTFFPQPSTRSPTVSDASPTLAQPPQPGQAPWPQHNLPPQYQSLGPLQLFLLELGFPGLPEAASFNSVSKAKKQKNATLACSVVEAIIGL